MEVQMKVIGAGLPRTATLTQKIALEMVGFGPCYHMVNVLSDLSLAPQWAAAFDGSADWDAIFEGHQSSVDWPGSFHWRELIDVYPEAKVLLSVRSGDSWATSMKNTIWGVFYDDVLMRNLSDARANVDPGWHDYIELMKAMWRKSGLIGEMTAAFDPNVLAAAMERYNQEVRDTVPAGRLLEWTPSDGWDPLCRFLDVPVPPAPLPHVNDSAQFAGRIIDGSLAVLNAWQAQQQVEAAGR
jgi:sulfotransferase family protein